MPRWAAAAMAVLFLVSLWPQIAEIPTIHALRYDDRPPIAWPHFDLDAATAAPGDQIAYTAIGYIKRAECHPPAGGGHVRYFFRAATPTEENNWIVAPAMKRATTWPASEGQHTGRSSAPIPTSMPPGQYQFTARACYQCAGASKELCETTPPRIVRIVAPHAATRGALADGRTPWTTDL